MPDRYQRFVSHGVGKALAQRAGLPRPAILRRHRDGDPVLPGPALLVGSGTTDLAAALARAGVTTVAATGADGAGGTDPTARLAAIVVDATTLDDVHDLAALPGALTPALRRLGPSARVVIVSHAPTAGDPPAVAATRQAIVGFLRSLAKELRNGATANLIQLGAAPVAPAALESTLRFLLSGRSAYVDGQVLGLDAGPAAAPADWDRPLGGAVAVVTGAARGIGAAIAATLARDGAQVVCADLPSAGETLSAVANEIRGTALSLDIAAADAPTRLAAFLRDRFGGVDVVVHNAGVTRDKLLANMSAEGWAGVLRVNLEAQLRINDVLLDGLLRDRGRIVCLSSTSGIAGNRGQTNYAASKAGVIGLVRATAPLLAQRAATINAVAPGFIDTDMTRHMPFATREVARRLNSLQQAGLPIDVAETVAWLASPGAGALTGQVIRVCGQNLVGA